MDLILGVSVRLGLSDSCPTRAVRVFASDRGKVRKGVFCPTFAKKSRKSEDNTNHGVVRRVNQKGLIGQSKVEMPRAG